MTSEVPRHHIRQSVCETRPPYREGRRAKAVKVYTVSNESRYLLIQGVPSVGASQELLKLCSSFGSVEQYHALDEYPVEDKYTEVYLVQYNKIQSARFAKRKLDGYSFFGGLLHVCYAPEHESVQETREKLQDRRRVIAAKIRQHAQKTEKQQLTSTDSMQDSVHNRDFSITNSSRALVAQNRQTVNSQNLHPAFPGLPDSRQSYIPTQAFSLADKESTFSLVDRESARQAFSLVDPESARQAFSLADKESTLSLADRESRQAFSLADKESTFLLVDRETTGQMFSSSSTTPTNRSQNINNNLSTMFDLPSPPKPNPQVSVYTSEKKSVYKYSRVPSSHATLPAGYDGRLLPPDNLKLSPQTEIRLGNDGQRSGQDLSQNSGTKALVTTAGVPPTQAIIVRDYKPTTSVPRFVPRQAVKKGTQKQDPQISRKAQADLVDAEIRRNAFQLGDAQGPAVLPQRKRNITTAAQKSMNDTISEIRTKISKVITESLPKR